MKNLFECVTAAADHIRKQISQNPRIAIILGSGLSDIADGVLDSVVTPYAEIPHFPCSTVEGHPGKLIAGTLAGVPVIVMQGRVHGYEGYEPEEVTFPMRVLARFGIKTVIVTNAAGGIRLGLQPGELVLISDHINFLGRNPLTGPNDVRFGPRFFDMTEAYSKRLRSLARQAAQEVGFGFSEGIYLALSGPSYETPAEIRAFRTLGADLVGMSTVPEVIVARHMGIEVLGISCVTNLAAGILDKPLDHQEVMETGFRAQDRLSRLLMRLVPQIEKLEQAG
jgi:purine-nucleoside phosphorylase